MMNYFGLSLPGFVLFSFALAIPAVGQTPTTAPSPLVDTRAVDAGLGKLFRSRIDGIQFNPPEGGTLIRELNSGEIVRFAYAETGWDLRVKPIVLAKPMPLSAAGEGGILELMASQLVEKNPTAIVLTKTVIDMPQGLARVGLIEARYDAGTDIMFAQEAIIRDTDKHYFVLQMNSPGKPKTAIGDGADSQEMGARKMLGRVLATVQVLDRAELGKEQKQRVYQTTMMWAQIDRKKILSTIQPLHFMRVLHDGKDIGFIQVDERLTQHNGNDGIEYIVHSRVESGGDQMMDAARSHSPAAAPGAGSTSAGNMILPKGLVSPTPPETGVVDQGRPLNVYTTSTYFVTFDRAHEDWNTTTQMDQQVASQLTEMGNSDVVEKRVLDGEKAAAEMKANGIPGGPHELHMKEVPEDTLDVSQYSRGRQVGKAVHAGLPPFYLPQAIGQMLPRLLPNDPEKYLFATYVSNQKNVMARYVDVDRPREVVLDEQAVVAIPISDRIGADGIPTIHYVTRNGEWLGSINDESKLVVLPTDEKTLTGIWKTDTRGFKVCPLPRLSDDTAVKNPSSDVKRP